MTQEPEIIIESLVVGPFQTNVYVVGCARTRQGAIIDAGGNASGLLELARGHDLEISKILQTHAHIDHVAALSEIKAQTKAPIYLHKTELPLYEAAPMQGAMFGFSITSLPPVDEFVAEQDLISVGELQARVLFLPGHSPGSVAFYFEKQGILFSGDVLFAGSIGRTDLPGGNVEQIKRSLARLKALPAATQILSGHGPQTTIGQELQFNPFLNSAW
ncbi:MAG: MBL fold metallo-hydrolase [Bradymonadaceae bacterium]|nr:MBL fold metallo-hydrolase [Lujinxingiaceae bacterium]